LHKIITLRTKSLSVKEKQVISASIKEEFCIKVHLGRKSSVFIRCTHFQVMKTVENIGNGRGNGRNGRDSHKKKKEWKGQAQKKKEKGTVIKKKKDSHKMHTVIEGQS